MKYLQWRDKKYPINITMSVIGDVIDEFNVSMDELDNITASPRLFRELFKFALIEGADGKDIDFTLTDKEVRQFFNEEYFNLLPMVRDFFLEVAAQMMKTIDEDLPKKKVRKQVYGK